MLTSREWSFAGARTQIAARSWSDPETEPRYAVLLVHGHGEHTGRYGVVASTLVDAGAVVYGLDHLGHGKSGGERVLLTDIEDPVADLHSLAETVHKDWPELPVVVIGHSMGGAIAARYAQLDGETLTALVLCGALVGELELLSLVLALDEVPDIPLDPTTLSRDPAVAEAYAADPLVWHGPYKRQTLEAIAEILDAINATGSIGQLPLLWIHGSDDEVIPIEGTRKGIEILRGSVFREHIYPGAKHELFNETNADEVLADVTRFIDEMVPS